LHAALQKIFAGAREGLTDTQVEFGDLLSLSPPVRKAGPGPDALGGRRGCHATVSRPEAGGRRQESGSHSLYK
jgi:hypothetical protein